MAIAPEHHNPAPPAATAGQESNVSAVEEMKKQAQAQVQAKEKENANEKEKAEGGVEEVKVNGHVNGANGASSPTSPTGPTPPMSEAPRGRKAVPCRFFHEGRCRYGAEDCAYSHILPWDEATMGTLVKAGSNGPSANGSGGPSPVGNGFGAQANGYVNGQGQGNHEHKQGQQQPGYYQPNGHGHGHGHGHDWQMYPQPTYGGPAAAAPGQQSQQGQPSQANGNSSSNGPSPPPSSGPTPPQQSNGYEHFYGASYGYPGGPNGYGMPPPPPFGASGPYGYYAPPLPGNPMYGGVPPQSGPQPNGYPFQGQQPGDGSMPNGFGADFGPASSAGQQQPGAQAEEGREGQQQQQQGPPQPLHAYQPYAPYPIDQAAMGMAMDPAVVDAHFSKGGHERTASLPHQPMFTPGALGPQGPMNAMRGGRLPPNPFAGAGRGAGRGGMFPGAGARGGRGGGPRPRYSTHDGSRLPPNPNGTDDNRPRGPRGPCSFFDSNACIYQDECVYAHVMPNGDDAREYAQNFAGPNGPVDPNAAAPLGPGRGGRMPKRFDFDPRAVRGYSIWSDRVRTKERMEREAAEAKAVAAGGQPAAPGAETDESKDIRQRLDEMVQQRRDGTFPPNAPLRGMPRAGPGGAQSRGVSATGVGRGVSPSQRVPSGDDFPALEPHRVTLPTRVVEPGFTAAGPASPNGHSQQGVDSLSNSIGDLSLAGDKAESEGVASTAVPGSPSLSAPAPARAATGSWASAAARALAVPAPPQNKSSATSPRRPARAWGGEGEQQQQDVPAAAPAAPVAEATAA